MTKQFTIKFLVFLVLIFIFIFPLLIVSAANLNYTPMEAIPGFGKTADFATFISNLYKFGIWTLGICALLMIVIGGYRYAASGGNNASMERAKGFITDALVGLVLALLAYLILYIINPELVKIKMTSVTVPVSPIPIEVAPSSSLATAATSLLTNSNIAFASSGDCKDASGATVSPASSMASAKNGNSSTFCNGTCKSGTPCTGQVTISTKLLDTINTIGKTNSLRVSSLTGGQHAASSIHYTGRAADIVPADKSAWDSIVSQFGGAGCPSFCDKGGQPVSCSAADHIHVKC